MAAKQPTRLHQALYERANQMRRPLCFKTIVYDSNQISPDVTSYSFFGADSIESGESVTRNSESTIVRWLFANKPVRSLILEEFVGCSNDYVYNFEVSRPIITEPGKKPGDIDILFCNKYTPKKAIAIECKRVKVIVQQDGRQKVNRIQEIDGAITQANGLQSIGFHQSYLLFLVVVDARLRVADGNILSKYADQKETSAVYEVAMNASLHPDVGVAYVEIIQPTGKAINKMGQVGICVDKRAVLLEQPTHLSEKVQYYFKKSLVN